MTDSEKPKKKGGFFKWVFIVLGVVVVLGVIGSLSEDEAPTRVASDNGPSASPAESTASTSSSRVEAALGEMLAGRRIAAQVDNIQRTQIVGNEFINEEAAGGATFVVVDYSYVNQSDGPIGSFNTPTVKLVSGNGTEYKEDSGASITYKMENDIEENAFSDLNPGITFEGAAVFEVSASMFEQGNWSVKVELDRGHFFVPLSQ